MHQVMAMVLVAVGLAGCVAGAGSGAVAQGEVYEPREAGIGSNIPVREKRAAATPEERERARIEAEAIRDSQNRANMPRREGMPRSQ